VNGSYTLQARAYDAAGNSSSSASITVSVQNTVVDGTAPTAQISSPTAGTTVSGTASVTVTAADNVGVTKVEWYLNGSFKGSSTGASAAFTWNTTAYANGSYTLQAKAYDAANNVGTSTSATVSVLNTMLDVTAPTVRITSPTSGVTVVKNTKVYVASSDNVAVTRVDLLVDGQFYATSSLAAAVFSWNSLKLAHGPHTLEAVAYDAAGNSTRSAAVTVYK
jgi:hypothetical protein